ncbi:MAG: ATP-binding protein [Candidatus Micrarchaeota archaeon]|nr:ATP-binding protein [Candidatus Micrarchaeota archaeon]
MVDNVFDAKEKLLSTLSWKENPFVKDLRQSDKEGFLTYYYAIDAGKVVEKLAFDAKACLLLGPKGVGKTSALHYISYSLPEGEFDKVMFKEPPETLNALADELGFNRITGISFIPFLSSKRDVTRQELARYLRNKYNIKKLLMLVDEAQLGTEMYMEFKYLLDEVANLRIVFSALDKSKFPDSLLHLIGSGNIFSRNKFTKGEMTSIIEHRISAVGGKAPAPFGEKELSKILTEQNLLSPRYVFDELNNHLAKLALGEEKIEPYGDDLVIQSAIQRSKQSPQLTDYAFTTSHAPWWQMLSPSQKAVIAQLVSGDGLTLHDLMDKTSLTQNTVFNALYQLRGDDEAERERKPEVPFPLVMAKQQFVGKRKKNLYFNNNKIKNVLTTH